MAHGAFQVALGYRAMALSLNVALLSGRSVHLSASLASTVDQLRLQAQMSLTLGQKPFRSLKKASDALASDLFQAVSCGFRLGNAWCQADRGATCQPPFRRKVGLERASAGFAQVVPENPKGVHRVRNVSV